MMKYIAILILGMIGGPIMWSMLNNTEATTEIVTKVFGIGVPVFGALLLLIIGGGIAVMLVRLGASITIAATNANDRWDAQKAKMLSEVFKLGATTSSSYLVDRQSGPSMGFNGEFFMPPVEDYRSSEVFLPPPPRPQ